MVLTCASSIQTKLFVFHLQGICLCLMYFATFNMVALSSDVISQFDYNHKYTDDSHLEDCASSDFPVLKNMELHILSI